MALTVDYGSAPFLITIPKADLTLESGTKYKLTVDAFWLLLRDFTDEQNTMAQPVLYSRIPATASTPSITEIDETYYRLEFEDGLYSVNIVNGNTNIRDVEVKNQVSVNTNNTTGFIDPVFLEAGLFNGQVCIDVNSGVSGTGKTSNGGIIGTRQVPSNNISDAKQICIDRGFVDINLMTSYTIVNEDLSSGYNISGDSPFLTLTVNPAANVTNCRMADLTLDGELDGLNVVERCRLNNVSAVSGMMHKIALAGDITVSGPTLVMESYSNWVGVGYASFDVGSHNIEIRDFHGSMGALGVTGGTHSIGITEGRLIVDGTAGTVHVRGTPYEIIDLSGGLVTIVDQTETSNIETRTWEQLKKVIANIWAS